MQQGGKAINCTSACCDFSEVQVCTWKMQTRPRRLMLSGDASLNIRTDYPPTAINWEFEEADEFVRV
ncbi:hypothetical protein C5167_044398 [Papaver somniferum]|uniref:Uncharacterized protein n=1 Tax=Papaver somniferum TaxID=3469 RepID=A0A4Y7LC09_PAPSO|nr:hypothetical protein C5167_044398 [Papaver somniferum]